MGPTRKFDRSRLAAEIPERVPGLVPELVVVAHALSHPALREPEDDVLPILDRLAAAGGVGPFHEKTPEGGCRRGHRFPQ